MIGRVQRLGKFSQKMVIFNLSHSLGRIISNYSYEALM